MHTLRNLELKASRAQNHLRALLGDEITVPRSKRDAPVFGFISRILGPIVGFTDYTEHEYLVQEVKKLYEDEDTITNVLNDSTHILQSEIDANREYLNKTSYRVQTLQNTTMYLSPIMTNAIDQVQRLEMMLYYTQVGLDTAELAANHVKSLHRFIESIEDAKNGRINHYLLTNEQLAKAVAQIRRDIPDVEPPFDMDNPDLGVLSEIAEIQLLHSEGKFIAIVTIPLMNKLPMSLYRMIPCKMPQQLTDNRTGSAFIQPSSKYIILALNKQTYYQADPEYLEMCVTFQHQYLCPVHQLSSVKTDPCCEIELLLDPSENSVRTCHIKILKKHKSHWTY
uniref:Envelope fusion protein n=1 Tax=Bracon brevicornis TaxID=1563983 RepID=A0A6V7L8B5_9HYME